MTHNSQGLILQQQLWNPTSLTKHSLDHWSRKIHQNLQVTLLTIFHPQSSLKLWCMVGYNTLDNNNSEPTTPCPYKPEAFIKLNTKHKLWLQQTSRCPAWNKVDSSWSTIELKTWYPHGLDGWCVGLTMIHYRFQCTYIPKIRADFIFKMMKTFPHNGDIPQIKSNKEAVASCRELTKSLQTPSDNHPITKYNNVAVASLKQLTDIFLRNV